MRRAAKCVCGVADVTRWNAIFGTSPSRQSDNLKLQPRRACPGPIPYSLPQRPLPLSRPGRLPHPSPLFFTPPRGRSQLSERLGHKL